MQEKLSPIQTELLSRADSIFASISAAVGKATDFAAVQIPEIAIQYVAYGRAYKTTLVLVFLAVFVIGLFLVVKVGIKNYYKASDDYNGDWDGSRYTASLIGLLFMLFGSAVVSANFSEFLMVWFAPKIWLITELVKLAK